MRGRCPTAILPKAIHTVLSCRPWPIDQLNLNENPLAADEGRKNGPSLLDWFKDSADIRPTLFCVDTNSEPTREEAQTVWRSMKKVYEHDGWQAHSVWDDHFDHVGKRAWEIPFLFAASPAIA